jgi:hypothetical protein
MNYYNPYMNFYPYATMPAAKTGLLSGLFKGGLNWGSILTNTQKTLGIVNQAIPVFKQAAPVFKNAKTMFAIMNEFKRVDTPVSTASAKTNDEKVAVQTKNTTSSSAERKNTNTNETINIESTSGPTFFV